MDEGRPWRDGRTGGRLAPEEALARLGAARVALLGERHDRSEDHRWQAAVLDALASQGRPVVVGFEMFPRRARPALDAWTRGALDDAGLLDATRWRETWGFAPELYQPLFDVCRRRGLPMRGLNIDRPLVSAIGRDGWGALPEAEAAWLSPARAATPAYRRRLFAMTGGARPDRAARGPMDPAFDRFVRAMQAWDRAFACALAAELAEAPGALAVGIVGRGHMEHGHGVPDQLDDLGVAPVVTALPDAPRDEIGLADLVRD